MLTIFAFAGCGTTSDNSATNTTGVVVETTTPVSTTHTVNQEHQLLEQFVAGEVEAGRYDSDSKFKITDLNMNTDEWDAYSVGDYCDLDNDGEDELILNGPYGGMYMDAKDDKGHNLDAKDDPMPMSHNTTANANPNNCNAKENTNPN